MSGYGPGYGQGQGQGFYATGRGLTPVVVRPARPCRHGVHLVLTMLTLGVWSPMWLIAWVCSLSPARKAKIEWR